LDLILGASCGPLYSGYSSREEKSGTANLFAAQLAAGLPQQARKPR
jgi:hypothetical protein